MPWEKNLFNRHQWQIRLTTVYGNTFTANSLRHFGRIMHVTDDSARSYLTGEYVTKDCKPRIMTAESYGKLNYQPYLDGKLIHYEILHFPESVKEETKCRALALQEYRNEAWRKRYEQKPTIIAKMPKTNSEQI